MAIWRFVASHIDEKFLILRRDSKQCVKDVKKDCSSNSNNIVNFSRHLKRLTDKFVSHYI